MSAKTGSDSDGHLESEDDGMRSSDDISIVKESSSESDSDTGAEDCDVDVAPSNKEDDNGSGSFHAGLSQVRTHKKGVLARASLLTCQSCRNPLTARYQALCSVPALESTTPSKILSALPCPETSFESDCHLCEACSRPRSQRTRKRMRNTSSL